MPLVEFPMIWTIGIDIVAWAFFHIAISFFTLNLPAAFFEKTPFLYRTSSWERDGRIWQEKFHIKRIANYIPDGSQILGAGFDKKTLKQSNMAYFDEFVLETKRAEFTHWLSILPAGLFFMWNPAWMGWAMVIYALGFNLPIIMLQRYNRPRLERIAKKKKLLHKSA